MDGDKAVDNEKELTSTSCGSQSPKPASTTNKEEKTDSNDTLPTSSTDASTFLKLNSSVSDDPISSTSEMNPSNPNSDKKHIDELDKASVSYDNEELMLLSMTQSEKVEENVDDLVNDLETLLGETAPSFDLPGKSNIKSKEKVTIEELEDFLVEKGDNEVSSNTDATKKTDVERLEDKCYQSKSADLIKTNVEDLDKSGVDVKGGEIGDSDKSSTELAEPVQETSDRCEEKTDNSEVIRDKSAVGLEDVVIPQELCQNVVDEVPTQSSEQTKEECAHAFNKLEEVSKEELDDAECQDASPSRDESVKDGLNIVKQCGSADEPILTTNEAEKSNTFECEIKGDEGSKQQENNAQPIEDVSVDLGNSQCDSLQAEKECEGAIEPVNQNTQLSEEIVKIDEVPNVELSESIDDTDEKIENPKVHIAEADQSETKTIGNIESVTPTEKNADCSVANKDEENRILIHKSSEITTTGESSASTSVAGFSAVVHTSGCIQMEQSISQEVDKDSLKEKDTLHDQIEAKVSEESSIFIEDVPEESAQENQCKQGTIDVPIENISQELPQNASAEVFSPDNLLEGPNKVEDIVSAQSKKDKLDDEIKDDENDKEEEDVDFHSCDEEMLKESGPNSEFLDSKEGDIEDNEPNEGSSGSEATKFVDIPEPHQSAIETVTQIVDQSNISKTREVTTSSCKESLTETLSETTGDINEEKSIKTLDTEESKEQIQDISVATVEDISETKNTEPVNTEESTQESSIQTVSSPKAEVVESVETDESQKIPFSDEGFVKETVFEDLNETKTEESADLVPCELTVDEVGEAEASEPAEMEEPIKESVIENVSEASKPINTLSEESLPSSTIGGEELCEITAGKTVLTDEPIEESIMEAISEPAAEHLSESVKINEDGATPEPTTLDSTTKDDPANDESLIGTTPIELVHLQEPEIDEPTEIEEPLNETISEVIQPEQLENSSSNAEIDSNKLQERDDSEVLIDKTKNLSKRSEPLPEDVPAKSPVLDAIPVCNVSEESPDLDAEEKSKIGPEIVNKDADFEASEDLVQTKTSTDAEPVTLKPEAVMVIKKEIKPAGSEIEPNLRVADKSESEVVEETMRSEEGVVESQSHSLEESHDKTESIACPIKASEVSQENVIQGVDIAVVATCESKEEIETEGSTSERILESRESHEVAYETEITEIVDKEEEMAELQLSEDENTTDEKNNLIPEVNIRRKTVEQDLEKVVCLSEESSDSDTNASAAPTAPTTTDDQSPFDGEANLIIAAEEAEQLDKETDVPIPVVEDLPNETAALESSNLETIMAVASLQQDTVPSISSERRLSEKEIREMEAIRMAVASITDSSQDTYDSYMVDNSLMMDAIPEVDNVESGMGNELAVDEETTTEVNDDRMDEVYDEIPAALENNDDLQIEPKDEQVKQASLNYILTDAPKMEEVIENVDKTPEATESIKLVTGIESHINDNSKESSSSEIVEEDCEETAEEIVLKDDESLNQQGVEKTNYEKDSEKLLEAESSKEVEYAGSKEHLEGSHATVKDKTDIAVPKIDQCEQKEEQAVNTERDSKTEANEGNKFNVLEQESEILNPTEHVQEKEETLKITKSAEVVKESIECPEPTKIEIFAKVADEPKTNTIEDIQIAEGSKEHKGHTSDLIAHSLKKVDECEDAQVDKDIMEELKIAKDKMKVNRKQRAAKPEETYAESHSSKEIEKKEDEVPNNVCKSMEKEVSEGPQEVAEDISEEQTTNAEKGEDEKPLRSRLRRGGTGKVSEPLSITVDEGEKEKVYSPKITIKPIKTVDEEVSTTSDADANKGSLKMTITKQADKLHSILKVYNPEDDTAPVQGQEEPIPKLIIKPKIQQVEQQHSPKMSTRSSRTYSPTGTRCSSPRVTIKPIPKAPEAKAEASSPIKITFKPVVKPEDSIKRHSPKLSKENDQKNQSPKITIKPIPKPADEELSVATPKVTIKPIKRPLEDPDAEGRASPKIIIKPVVKPTEQDQPEQAMPKLKIKAIRRQNEENELEKDQGSPRISIKTVKPPEDEAPEDEVKERIVLKINKGNLPTPSKDSKKREYPEDDKAEKTGIKLKFSTTGGHTHIVQENEDSNKRQRKDSGYSGKDLEENTSHKRALEEKLPERNKRLKHTPDKFNDSSNVKMDETKVNSLLTTGGDSRSQHSDVTPDEFSRISKIADIASRTTHMEAVPQEITVGVVTPTQSPVPKKRPGRPRKIPLTPKEGMETPPLTPQSQLGVEQIATPPTSDVGTPEATPSPGGRPKRSCRTTNVIAALGIKPKRSRGGRGGGRGSKVNMGDREPPPTPEQLPKPEKPEKAKKDVEKKSEVTDTSKLIVEGPVEEQNTPNNGDSETPNTSSKSVTDSVKTEKKELTKQDVPSIKLEESDDKLKDDNDKQKESSDLQSKPGGTVEEEAPIKKKKEDKTPPRKLEVTTRRQKAQLEKEAEAAKLKENPRVETRRSQQKKDETPKVELRRTSVSPKGNPKKTTTVVEPISDTTPPKVGKGNPKKLDNTASPQTDTPLSRKGVGKRTQSTEYVVEADDSPGKSIKVPAKKTLNIESPATVGKVATRKSPSVEGPIQHSLSSPKKTVPEESKNPISAEKGPITRRKSLCIEPVASTSKTPVTTVEDVIIISTDEDDSCGKEDLEDKGEETVPVPNESVIKHSLAVEISDKPTRPKEKTSTPKKVVEKHNEPSVPENVPKPVVVETRRQSKSVEKKETEEIIGEDPLKITIEDQTRALKLKEEFTKPKKEVIDEAVEITELKNEPKVELKFEEAEDSDDEDKKEEDSDSDDSETEKRNAWVLMRKREAIVKCRAKRMEKLAKIAEQKKKRLEQVAQQREARKAVEEAEKLTQNRATKRYGRYGAPKPQISLIDEPVIEIEGTIKSAIGLFDPVTKKIGVFEPIDDDDTEKSPERPLTKTHFSVPEPMVVDSADNSPTKHGRSLTDEDVVMLDEDTQMSADFRQSAPGTPAKQSNNPSDIVEDSQGSLGTEGGKSRSSKGPPKMEVFQDLEQAFTGDQLAEYSWNGQGPFMLQEQVTQFLGIKSFKRKYPNIPRRPVDMQERDYLKENAMVTEAQCDLGLTAVIAQDILDIMYLDFQDKYEEYCRCQREKQARELANKQKALSLTALKPGFDKLDLLEQAIQSAASWNQQLNKSRREERRTHMDLQTFTIHYPKSKMKVVSAPKIGHYPVALVPGQFTDYYHEYTPTELNNLPINTMCYDEIKPYIESEDSGSSSDSESESDSDSSSSSSSCDDKDCKDCQRDEGTEGNETKETDSDVVFIDNDASSSDSVVLVSVTAPPAAVSA